MTEIDMNNISINYKLEGKGKTIVFVHGLSDNLKYWNILTDDLKNEYQTLSFDIRGHGKSSDDDSQTSIDLYQEDLYQLLKELEIEEAVFVGLSLGGNIIMDLAIKHPELARGLIIMSSFPHHTENLKEIFDDFYESIEKGFIEFYDTILPYTLTNELLEKHKELLDKIKHEAAKTANIEGIKKGILAGYGFNITDRLHEIDAPTLVIAGAEDNLTDLEIQKKISEEIKGSKMIVLEKTKHNILIGKNIEKMLNIIREFMNDIN